MRIETYENKETEKRIREILNGRYANTAFVIFDPQGTDRLSGTGRSPSQVLGKWGEFSIVEELEVAALPFERKGKDTDAVLQDFLSFGQALNVASADQRLLVFVDGDKAATRKLTPTLQKLFADEDIIGRFHLDFAGKEDDQWGEAVKGSTSKPAINIIRSGKFGLDGSVMSRLPLDSSLDEIKATLLADNEKFSSSEERKIYAKHVMEGKRNGIKYESEIPYGEDRDGDGDMDKRGRRGGNRSGGGMRGQGGMRDQGQRRRGGRGRQ